MKDRQSNGQKIPSGNKKALLTEGQTKQWTKDTKGLKEDVNQWKKDKTMDKRYQGVKRRCKSMKEGQNNGQKIPRGNKKALFTEGQTKQWTKDTKG